MEVEEKEIFCLLGPNGSGKTTLIYIILTLIIPDEGKVEIFGKDPFVEKEVLQRINSTLPYAPYSHLTVKRFLTCYARLYGVGAEKVESVLRKLRLKHIAKRECWRLSTGQSSCLMLAKALLNDPELLILDEPMVGIDPKTKEMVRKLLKSLNQEGITILIATHDMLEVERLATRVAFIKEGKILEVKEKGEIIKRFGSVEKYWLKLGR